MVRENRGRRGTLDEEEAMFYGLAFLRRERGGDGGRRHRGLNDLGRLQVRFRFRLPDHWHVRSFDH